MPLCHICHEEIKISDGTVAADNFQPWLLARLEEMGGDVNALCNSPHGSIVNAVTMQYFYQFNLTEGERRDETLQASWIMNPPQRFGIVCPRIPADKSLFIAAHTSCINLQAQFMVSLKKLAKPKMALELTRFLKNQDWFNAPGWIHVCADLYGRKNADAIERKTHLM